jgi:hypothetical protein
MKTFNRSAWEMIKGVIYAPFSAIVIVIIVSFFTVNRFILYGLAAAVFLAMLYIALISSNIYFEVTPDGKLRYFKGGSLKQSFDIAKCGVGYYRKSDSGFLQSHTLWLKILPEGRTKEIQVDCDALGLNRFMEMYELLDKLSANEIETLSADKPQEED